MRSKARFLRGLRISIKAVQTDNGSSFLKEFDKMCKERGIPHYFIYPGNPKKIAMWGSLMKQIKESFINREKKKRGHSRA